MVFTDRHGGVSTSPFNSLNLALADADSAENRHQNLDIVLDRFGAGSDLAEMRQVHGRQVAVMTGPGRPEADALVTTTAELTLLVRVADCVPVLMAAEQGVIGAVHAGRQGLALGVAERAVARMRDLGAETISAWLGPHICGSCYEVPADLQQLVGQQVPAAICVTRTGTPGLDLAAGLTAQLAGLGVVVHQVGGCTLEDENYYSYRRDGQWAGRQAGLIRMMT